ncbi:MAG: hypothetical protein GY866_12390 [Proteobacteria bacterium]|nr:hypothetical protein [Pseudomonadota bacterium]
MKKLLGTLLLAFLLSFQLHASSRGIGINIRDKSGKQVGMYAKSHALLIGVSDYTAGWPDLQTIPDELTKVETILKKQGFNVVTVLNPNSKQLENAFEDFIDKYGYNENDRLLFFFSGHGYSRKNGKKGYLVPADAPNPKKDKKGFLRKALNMSQIITWSRQMESKHALFLFDSCFSGAIFKTKALPKTPPHINAFTASPVRQYITAGSAGEEVPASSVFTPSFVRALEGEADLNRDGYVTGTEMGMFLNEKVMGYNSQQTPQYGKIKDPDLDRGDFVFVSTKVDTNTKRLKDKLVDLKNGLIAHYPLNGNANDITNNKFHGRVRYALPTEDRFGIRNRAYKIFFLNHIVLPHQIFNRLNDFTFSFWMSFDSLNTAGKSPSNTILSVASKRKNAGNELLIEYVRHRNQFSIQINNKGSKFKLKNELETKIWQFVTVTRKGSKADLYINGIQTGKKSIKVNNESIQAEEGGVMIGQEQDRLGGCLAENQNLNGDIDEIRIYNRALNETEVLALYKQ